MGRPPLGERAMTAAERQQRRRHKLKQENEMSENIRPVVTNLPVGRDEWIKRFTKKTNFNDKVRDLHIMLTDDPQYVAYLNALFPDETVEGSIILDHGEAAKMLRKKAAGLDGYEEVAKVKLNRIVRAIHVIMRQAGLSPGQRLGDKPEKPIENEDNGFNYGFDYNGGK